jgi:hypothetical protein
MIAELVFLVRETQIHGWPPAVPSKVDVKVRL